MHVQPAYSVAARAYDTLTNPFEPWRRRLVEQLALRAGDTVVDAGCGTGLCLPGLRAGVGPTGTVLGVDPAPAMLEQARARVRAAGWANVRLFGEPAGTVRLPGPADHALFCAVHDVLQSDTALDNVLSQVRSGGTVSAGGGKWAPLWLALNAGIAALHAPFVRDFTGFDRPWAKLAERLVDLRVREVALGAGYLAWGRVP